MNQRSGRWLRKLLDLKKIRCVCAVFKKNLRNSIHNLQKYFLQSLLILSNSFVFRLIFHTDTESNYFSITLSPLPVSLCVCISSHFKASPPFPLLFFFQVFPLILLLLNHKISEEKWQKGIATV